ncbi:LemA family protein [Aldersonia sp. NBC_00410]|uniref:LemA family protein n=1 Tax=Aldersonia sp. NBC_00410 TaxID=2975954 RepID=UPI00225B77C1|nr:LemA family protein [Aldersonia sp. NBC_00410]MCX5043373.1 LemA family protein [Aldersonia sp. NBC_00410]
MGALIAVGVLILIGIVVVIVAIGMYNRLVRERNGVDNAWAQTEVQLKRRYDLIPNLVETVKGYASHERQTFEAVTAARSAAIDARGPAEQAKAENALSAALRSVFAVAEAYPQLQASTNFVELQNELSDTENRIAYARQYYNDAVLTYNTSAQTVPTNIIAGAFGFTVREFFATPETERGPVRVQF